MVSVVPPPPASPAVDPRTVAARAAEHFAGDRAAVFRRADRLLAGLVVIQCLGGLGAAAASSHPILLGAVSGLLALLFVFLVFVFLGGVLAGRAMTRHVLTVSHVLTVVFLSHFLGGPWGLCLILLSVFGLLGLWEMRWRTERRLQQQMLDAVVAETAEERSASEAALRDAHERMEQFHDQYETGTRRRAEELAAANDALQRNNSVLRAQQEATVDGILVVDEERDVSSYNHRFCQLWGVSDALMTADEDWTLLQHVLTCVKDPDAFLSLMNRCYEQPGEQVQDEVELVDGRIFERYTRPIFSETDQYYGRVWYFRDITERKRAEGQILVLNHGLSQANEAITQAYDATIEGWSRALDLRDKETEGHCRRVTDLTLRLAIALGLCGEELIQIRRGALLHDIGKMGVPDQILLKPGALTEEEWAVMRRHPQYAHEMLAPIAFLRPALDIPWCHHERWDGAGYPRGLSGEAIPLAARLFAVVDVWDALRSDRPYRKAWPEDRVRDHIRSLTGTHFDPAIVPIFLEVVSHEDMLSDIDLVSAMDLFARDNDVASLPLAA